MSAWLDYEPPDWWRLVEDALAEDLGSGDVSSVVLPAELKVRWTIEAQQTGVVCGVGVAEYLLAPSSEENDDAIVRVLLPDGSHVSRGDRVAEGSGLARRVLTVERTALNFLMLLSGVATLTAEYVQKVSGTGARIVDTRKTIPLLRGLQKYAVRCGGGFSHRMGLFDGAMLKDNHIQASKSLSSAVRRFRSTASHMTKLEVECETIAQVEEAVAEGVEIIMLDNMDPFEMREVVKKYKGRCLLKQAAASV